MPAQDCNELDWLPRGKTAAICFSIDDVHPSAAATAFDAGGDLGAGVLGRLRGLLDRHAALKATLFVTPDWRPVQLVRTRLLSRMPVLSKHVYHVDLHPPGLLQLGKHPLFVEYLNRLPKTDVALHGLHHVHRGPRLAVEFQQQTYKQCVDAVSKGMRIFTDAGLAFVKGFSPPGWNLPPALLAGLEHLSFEYVTSARDIRTPVAADARNNMSGLPEVSILRPQLVGAGRIVHLPVNFQATSPPERAHQLVRCGGLLSIKAHAFKQGGGYTMLDGLDEPYCEYLDSLFSELEQRYGDSLWWASMSEIAALALESWRVQERWPMRA